MAGGYVNGQYHSGGLHQHSRGTALSNLLLVAKNLWMWALERNIHIVAQHLLVVLNSLAHAESQMRRDQSDWKLHPAIFHGIN